MQNLHREGFVELPQTDVINRQSMLLQQLRHGEYWTNAHLIGFTTSNRDPTVSTEGIQTQLLCSCRFHHHLGRCAIR